jgi:hypothetical protein
LREKDEMIEKLNEQIAEITELAGVDPEELKVAQRKEHKVFVSNGVFFRRLSKPRMLLLRVWQIWRRRLYD